MAVLLFCLGVAALLASKTWPAYDSFLTGSPIRLQNESVASARVELGPLTLHRRQYYLIHLRCQARTPFRLGFTYQNQQTSKALVINPQFVGEGGVFEGVIQAGQDDAAVRLCVTHLGSEAQINCPAFSELTISQLDPRLYVVRATIRYAATILILAASAYLAWTTFKRWPTALPSATAHEPSAFWRIRRVGSWAAVLLAIGICFDGFFLADQHQHLFDRPFQPSITGWDGSFYYFWLRSVMVDGDVDFSNDILYCNSMSADRRADIVQHIPRTPNGLIPDKYPIGWALLELPWYLTATCAVALANLFGARILFDGWGPVYQVFFVLGQVVYATAGLYHAYRIVREYLPPACALCGVMLGWLGSSLFFYQTLDISMSHNVMFFATTGAYYVALRVRQNPEKLVHWLLAGFLSACVILARYQGVVLLVFPVVVCLQATTQDLHRLKKLCLAAFAGALPLSLQIIAWKKVFGSYFLDTYGEESFSWLHPHWRDVLFSPLHGLFNWHPLMLVGFAGFLAWAVCSPRRTDAICFAISLGLVMYINAAWDVWWFGASFGSRAFEACTLFSMLGIGFVLSLLAQRALAFQVSATILLLLALWNMNLLWMAQTGRLPLEVSVAWKQRLEMSAQYWFPGWHGSLTKRR